MKNTNIKRQAVFPVLVMLVVTALALIGSSFAWFTVANTASVAQITTSAQSDGVRLEISKDANRYNTRSIDINSGAISAILPSALYQVSTTGLLSDRNGAPLTGFQFFDSEYSGFTVNNDKELIVSKKDTTVTEGADGKLSATIIDLDHYSNYGEQGNTFGEAFDATTPTYIVFDLYFATDRAADIYFYNGTAIRGKNPADTSYSDTADVLKALRVGVVYLGSTETATDVVALNGANGTAGTIQNSVAIWQVSGTDSTYGINAESYNATEPEFEPYSKSGNAENFVNATAVETATGSDLIVTDKNNVTGTTQLLSI